jgi:hypothetical protein
MFEPLQGRKNPFWRRLGPLWGETVRSTPLKAANEMQRVCAVRSIGKILASLMPETPRVAQDEELKPGLSAARPAALLCAWRMATRVSGLEPRIIVSIA